MRWLIILIGLVHMNKVTSQIMNGSFDDWEIISMHGQPYENPVNWKTNNSNYPAGFANTPVTKGADSLGFFARIESNDRGIDAVLPGKLGQTISTNNLDKITFNYKCDSIFQSGTCVLNILDQDQQQVLFTDSITIEDSEVKSGNIDMLHEWILLNDSITIQFVAKGNLDMWDKEEDGYSIFLIDNVSAEYSTDVNHESINQKPKIIPNPSQGIIHIGNEQDFDFSRVEIYTITGNKVFGDKYAASIDLSWVPDGTYIIRLNAETETIVEYVIIQK